MYVAFREQWSMCGRYDVCMTLITMMNSTLSPPPHHFHHLHHLHRLHLHHHYHPILFGNCPPKDSQSISDLN